MTWLDKERKVFTSNGTPHQQRSWGQGRYHETTYQYVRPRDGVVAFEKLRYKLDPELWGRSKDFGYRFQCDPRSRCVVCSVGIWKAHRGKPDGADGYLFRLPEVLEGIRAGRPIWWAEGERDALTLASVGAVGTSHHGGAGKVNAGQARWLVGAKQIILSMDSDGGAPEKLHGPGAYDVWLRHEKLIQVGLRPDQIKIVRTRAGKDVSDHLAAGYLLRKLVVVDKDRIQRIALESRPPRRRVRGPWAMYRGGA